MATDGFDEAAVPAGLKEREQWLLWSTDTDPPKRPLNADGFGASWNDPGDWLAFEDALELARKDGRFDGIGYVIAAGDPYVGIDLDGCLREPFEPKPKDWLPALDDFQGAYIEYSQSGTGLHLFVEADALPNWWADVHFTDDEHEGVEAYAEKFFIVTGRPLEAVSGPTIEAVDVAPFLRECYEAVSGEPPHLPGGSGRPGDEIDADVSVYDVISRSAYPEGENRGHPFHPSDTGANFRVDEGGRTFRCWRHGVTGNGAHLLGIEHGVIECGDWVRSELTAKDWRDIFDAGRDAGYDIPDPTSSDETADDASNGWGRVRDLFNHDANGTTTKAYNLAAELVCRDHDFVKIRESGAFYYYDDGAGHYVRRGQSYLEEFLNDRLGDDANINRRREIIERVAGESYVDSDAFRPPAGLVNVENGVLDLDEMALLDHSPEYYFTARVRAKWPGDGTPEPEAAAWWDRALKDANPDRGERRKINEFVGYCLEPWHHAFEKNMFFVGFRRSGKSTVQEAIEALFGGFPTVANITPQQLADSKFDAAALRDAQLNTVNDINATKIEDTGTLKRAFSGERMKLEEKYKMPEFAAPTAKHLFTANWLPTVVGSDEALYRRLLIVEFADKLTESEQDPEYKERLKRPGIRQAILVAAVNARKRLHETKGFTSDRSDVETRQLWEKWQDSHKLFLFTHFELTGNEDDHVDRSTYWMEYEFWAGRMGFEIKSHNSITRSLQFVPKVFTPSDSSHYGGLVWLDRPTNEETSGDPDQTNLALSQSSRKKRVVSIIERMDEQNGAIPKPRIIGYAEAQGLPVSQVKDDIEDMLTRGQLIEESAGEVRLT